MTEIDGDVWDAVGVRLRDVFQNLLVENGRLEALLAAYSRLAPRGELVDAFYRRIELKGSSKSTVRQYRYVLTRFLNYTGGRTDVTTDVVEAFLAEGASRGWTGRTINNNAAVLRAFYRFAAERGLPDPTVGLLKAKVTSHPRIYLTRPEIHVFLSRCVTRRDYVLVRTMIASGLRVSELVGLDVSDVDERGRRLTVRSGKGGKYRVVDVDPGTTDLLVAWVGGRCSGPLFVNRRNSRLNVRTVQRVLASITDGFEKKITPHKLRHTTAMTLLNSGASLETVRSELGHADFGTTKIYADVEDSRRTSEYVTASPFREVFE